MKRLFLSAMVLSAESAVLNGFLVQCIPVIPSLAFCSSVAVALMKCFLVALAISVFLAIGLTWVSADFYLESSKGFAKYNGMLFQSQESVPCRDDDDERPDSCESSRRPLLNMDVLRIPARTPEKDDSSRAVLLTGATGFIGRLLLRDLLLHRKELAIGGGVVALCRAKRGRSAMDRISALLDDPIYSFLGRDEKNKLVRVVESDVTKANIGLSKEDMESICNVWNVSTVIHCAASVSFQQTLRDAALSNISATLNLQALTGRLRDKSARFVHISTAFVHGGLTGSEAHPLPEQLHPLHGYDARDLYQSMLGTEYDASAAMKALRFPNAYAFSKCICEHLLSREKSVPTIVIRPSIVGPSVQQPFEGWAGNRPTTIVAAGCLYLSYQWNLWCFGNHHVPYIPVDVVTRYIITRAFGEHFERSHNSTAVTLSLKSTVLSGPCPLNDLSDSESTGATESTLSTLDESLVRNECFAIHNLAWASGSPDSAMFSWIDYAAAVTHLGAVFGAFSPIAVYLGSIITVRILPRLNVNEATFGVLHYLVVLFPVNAIVSLFKFVRWWPRPIELLSKLSGVLDLPFLFFRFMNCDFYFESELVAPEELNGERYVFSCATASKRFISSIEARMKGKQASAGTSTREKHDLRDSSSVILGGRAHRPASADLWWALTQPRGTFFLRCTCWMLRKVLRRSSDAVTVDTESFSPAVIAQSSDIEGQRPHLILASNSRSFLDSCLINYVCFALPELQVEIPSIVRGCGCECEGSLEPFAARRDTSLIWCCSGRPDASLKTTTVSQAIESRGNIGRLPVRNSSTCDLQSLSSSLSESGKEHLIVPVMIEIDDETLRNQFGLVEDLDRGYYRGLGALLKSAWFGTAMIGRIHIVAACPMKVDCLQQTSTASRSLEQQHSFKPT